jgi:hypothetical protein
LIKHFRQTDRGGNMEKAAVVPVPENTSGDETPAFS